MAREQRHYATEHHSVLNALLRELVLNPVAEIGTELRDLHALFGERLAPPNPRGEQRPRLRHTHLAVAALVAPTKTSQDGHFVPNYILDAREEHFSFGHGEASAFYLDLHEIEGAQLGRVLLDWGRLCLGQTWNDSPQPQLPVEFGLLKRKPEPMMSSTKSISVPSR